jgi:hypothetical protein
MPNAGTARCAPTFQNNQSEKTLGNRYISVGKAKKRKKEPGGMVFSLWPFRPFTFFPLRLAAEALPDLLVGNQAPQGAAMGAVGRDGTLVQLLE